ncbi:response regulator [Pseudarthrobacter sp. N5]|uniref:response regulator transcription factor n=1 Tax=Pseudarthrobacter sp. N5 TaxID=3418416 RepID=UPI003CF9717A
MIRILLADDQTLIRAGFRALLTAEPDMEVIAECGSGHEAVRLARRDKPDVVLMDIRMPDGDGLAATRQIMAAPELAGTRVIILTTFELDDYIAEAVRAGAAGFLVKDTEPEELLRAVRVVHDGDALLSPSVTRRIMAQLAVQSMAAQSRAAGQQAMLGQITGREREVLQLVGEGLNNAEIAERLFITPLTAKTHVSRIMTKLLIRDRVQLVVLAYESGLVRPGWSG